MGLFDKVTIYNEMTKGEMTLRIVTTLRQDALKGPHQQGVSCWKGTFGPSAWGPYPVWR